MSVVSGETFEDRWWAMRVKRAVVLVIDRLGAGWIGPYGNTWLETPNFNRLAAESLLFETAIADSAELAKHARSLWTGQHAAAHGDAARPSLAALARRSGGTATLLTDEPGLAEHSLAGDFSAQHVLSASVATRCAESLEHTELFAFFAAARALVEQQTEPGLIWLHARGMGAPWDGPVELRQQFADEEDPEPPLLVQPPREVLESGFDPDLLLGYSQAYAGQVALADLCLGLLLEALEEQVGGGETMLVVTSPRGFPLGEHRRVGDVPPALYGELLQVPLLVRVPGMEAARLQRVVQPNFLAEFVAERCGWIAGDDVMWGDELIPALAARGGLAVAMGEGQRAIRTPAWFLRELTTAEGTPQYELFAKSDDRWEANEVSALCRDAVELLAAELDRFAAAPAARQIAETAPLAELLCDAWR